MFVRKGTVCLVFLCIVMLLLPTLAGVWPASAAETAIVPNSVQQILARDGYLEGIWFPWFNHVNLGHGLTSNEVMVEYVGNAWATVGMDDYGTENLYQQIYNLKALGFNIMGYEGSVYSEGVILDQQGDVLGIKEEYLYNVRRFLDICRDVGMPVLWTVCCHSSSVNDYYTYGKLAWDVMCRYYADRQVADHYAQRFVAPLCQVLAEYPDVVVMTASTIEAENEINDSDIGNNFSGGRALYGVTQESMLYFINAVTETVKEHLPNVTRTIGSQSADMSIYKGIDFDWLGDQNYNYAANSYAIEGFQASVPMFVSEFGLGFEQNYDDNGLTTLQLRFRDNFRADGFKGWLMWCWSTDRDQPGSTYSLIKRGGGITDFRSTAYALHYYIEDYRAQHRGETVALDIPVLFCNTGSGLVEWIAPRTAHTITLHRSDDGGATWYALVENAPSSDYVKEGKGVYRDRSSVPGAHTVYRVTVQDGAGRTATSVPSNEVGRLNAFKTPYTGDSAPACDWGEMPFGLPYVSASNPLVLTSCGVEKNRPLNAAHNLLTNPGFEKSSGGQWNNRSFLSGRLQVVTDPTAPNGDKSLYFNTADTGVGEWHTFWVDVEPNTDYVFSAWLKGGMLSKQNRGYATMGVVDPATERFIPYTAKMPFYTQTKQLVPPAWDDQWHLRSVEFYSGDRTRVGVAVYGCRSEMWIDDLALFQNGQGGKYVSPNMSGVMTFDLYSLETSTCRDKDCLTENPRLEDADSSYWQTGDGFDSGFMSLQQSDYGYGNSLKYTATKNPVGLHYIRWVEVKPHTDYVFSFNLKVLKSGGGRLVLLDGKKLGAAPQFFFDFDQEVYGDQWVTLSLGLNSDVFDTVGIGVVDLGGEALLDNLRLYKTVDGTGTKDLYLQEPALDAGIKATAPSGKTAKVTVKATGEKLKYTWYYKNKGDAKFAKTTAFTGATYSVAMSSARNGRQVYCVVSDRNGNKVQTPVTTLRMGNPVKVTAQPKTGYAKEGATVKTTVKATGDGLKYTWYIKNAGGSKYTKSSVTKATYSATMSDKVHGRRVYCVVSDKYGNTVKTDTVLLRRQATVTSQPAANVVAKRNATAKIAIQAKGDSLTYTWYIKNAGGTKFSKSSVTGATYSCRMTSTSRNRQVYCVVKDKYGKTAQTKTFTLRMAVGVVTQPKSATVANGKTAKVTVKAEGDGLRYEWYLKNEGATKYTKSSITSATYSCKMSAKVDGRRLICYIYDKYGNRVQTKTVILKKK